MQLPGGFKGKKIDVIQHAEIYERLFKNVISKLDTGSHWIVNHDFRDNEWFPDNTLKRLRALFKRKDVPNAFKGALLFQKDELLDYAADLILYPYGVHKREQSRYSDIDVSHGELPFIIKISAHLNIDFINSNQDLLKEVVIENLADPLSLSLGGIGGHCFFDSLHFRSCLDDTHYAAWF